VVLPMVTASRSIGALAREGSAEPMGPQAYAGARRHRLATVIASEAQVQSCLLI